MQEKVFISSENGQIDDKECKKKFSYQAKMSKLMIKFKSTPLKKSDVIVCTFYILYF